MLYAIIASFVICYIWKSCDGQQPSEGSNPSHCAKKKSTALRCFSFWVPVQTDISIRMEGKSLDKHSP